MFHGDYHALRADNQVHGTAHAGDFFAGHAPVGYVAVAVHLQRAQHAHVKVSAPGDGETQRAVEKRAVFSHGGEGAAGVYEIGVDVAFVGGAAETEAAVVGIQRYVDIVRYIIGDERRQAYAEIHDVAVFEFFRHAAGD